MEPCNYGTHSHLVRKQEPEVEATGGHVMQCHLPEVILSLFPGEVLDQAKRMVAEREEDVGHEPFWSFWPEAPDKGCLKFCLGVLPSKIPRKPDRIF